MVNVDVKFSRSDATGRVFLTWRPIELSLAVVGAPAGAPNVDVTLSAKGVAGGARLQFSRTLTHKGDPAIDVALPADGREVVVWVSGAYPSASKAYGDVAIEVRMKGSGQIVGGRPVMVRVRKDANALTAQERDRFIAALATLNGSGTGRYSDFRDMHIAGPPDIEAHGGPGFLPWHRAYLLDFERELQSIDPEVSLPYWRFDKAAPKVFNRAFMGVPNAFGQVQFSPTNPLTGWVAQRTPGVDRGAGVGPTTVPAVLNERDTIALGGAANPTFGAFSAMQGNPHGAAHMSHRGGWITNPATAPRDPVFFLLHCNVDRLWAKWQWAGKRHDPGDASSYVAGRFRPGHNLPDTLWPWSGPLRPPRPTTAPGGGLASSPMSAAPGTSPKVYDMIDYLGTMSATQHAFAYDDVPFLK